MQAKLKTMAVSGKKGKSYDQQRRHCLLHLNSWSVTEVGGTVITGVNFQSILSMIILFSKTLKHTHFKKTSQKNKI